MLAAPQLIVPAHIAQSRELSFLQSNGVSRGALMRRNRYAPSVASEPSVPESFIEELKQFNAYYGVHLRLVWQCQYGYWTLLNDERAYDPDKDAYPVQTVFFEDLLTEAGENIPLDNRVFDWLASKRTPGNPHEYANFVAKKKADREKAKAEKVQKQVEEIFPEAEKYVKAAFDHTESPSDPKVRSFPGVKFADKGKAPAPAMQIAMSRRRRR